jgi:hypothetical protein
VGAHEEVRILGVGRGSKRRKVACATGKEGEAVCVAEEGVCGRESVCEVVGAVGGEADVATKGGSSGEVILKRGFQRDL